MLVRRVLAANGLNYSASRPPENAAKLRPSAPLFFIDRKIPLDAEHLAGLSPGGQCREALATATTGAASWNNGAVCRAAAATLLRTSSRDRDRRKVTRHEIPLSPGLSPGCGGPRQP